MLLHWAAIHGVHLTLEHFPECFPYGVFLACTGSQQGGGFKGAEVIPMQLSLRLGDVTVTRHKGSVESFNLAQQMWFKT